MICIFCGETHPSEHFICDIRHTASIDRLVMLSTRPTTLRQFTLPELVRRQMRKKKIQNTIPIVISDSSLESDSDHSDQELDKNTDMPTLSRIPKSFLDTLDRKLIISIDDTFRYWSDWVII